MDEHFAAPEVTLSKEMGIEGDNVHKIFMPMKHYVMYGA
jgi:hypothetical protein